MKNLLIVLFAIFLFAACNDSDSPYLTAEQEDVPLLDTQWVLSELNGVNVEFSEAEGRNPTLVLQEENSRAAGFGGCNNYNGVFTSEEENKLRFSDMAATKMYCVDSMETEEQLFDVYTRVKYFRLSGDTLELLDEGNQVLAVFRSAVSSEVTD